MPGQESLAFEEDLRREARALGLDFLAAFLEAAVGRRPELSEALAELGHVYTLLGRYEDGLRIDLLLVERFPGNPTVHYNLACSLALLGRADASLDALERAVECGYDDAHFMSTDEDLASVRDSARFQELARRLREA